MIKKILILCILLSVSACTMGGATVAKEDLNKVVTCTDLRDMSVFKFNTNSVTNIRVGIGASSSMDVVTLKGKPMTLSNDQQSWVKCGRPV